MRGGNGGVPRVAVAGCGHWGRNLVRNYASLGALAALHDPDATVATALSTQHGVPARSWPELLADPEIEAVVIAAPAALHAGLATKAIEAGKPVFVEKPLALEVAEAEALCALAESHGRVLMVGHLLQYHPAFLALKELVARGELGRLQYLYSNRLNLGRVRREENILWSFAPHDVSMILSLVGAEPEKVAAVSATYLHKRVADLTTTHMDFPAGERAHVFVSWLHPFKEQKLVVVGEQAMAVFDDTEPWARKLVVYRHRIEWRNGLPQPSRAEGAPVPLEPREPLLVECQHFLACLETGARPRTDGQEGLRVLRVLQAAQRSMEEAAQRRHAAPQAVRPGVFVHESAYIDEPCEIGGGTKIWHFSHVMAGARIGRNVTIGQNVMLGAGAVIGDSCKIQNNVSVYSGVVLEPGVFCGPSCVFTNVGTPRAEIDRRTEFRPTRVGRGATIGANATIVCGHTIGAYAFVAAGAVVTRDVPPHALVAGVPARQIGWVSHAGERLGEDLVCPREGRRYRVVDGRLTEAAEATEAAEPVGTRSAARAPQLSTLPPSTL
ncbi:MAG: Gfo/Idh/MocA family oxidoreductase [Rhodospirillaceae bacterium]|nr:Gfo/Idh/MocA family oxidoreductase [Rhodospirillaceae bacterium]